MRRVLELVLAALPRLMVVLLVLLVLTVPVPVPVTTVVTTVVTEVTVVMMGTVGMAALTVRMAVLTVGVPAMEEPMRAAKHLCMHGDSMQCNNVHQPLHAGGGLDMANLHTRAFTQWS
jgi:hypothetical protein